ncbi:hypothetical protein SmJEL517_g04052 [Synchytrium microbalum]|uniref:CCHC-type domain-containing protein n=1 Tax=Synchytrium microbalum TaxID=1806994 RepID=A0A507C0D6_9FUNG|nr:uncharacterized protein SmJEL517_g04052 [Synchytrium microbalum]TPX32871.1 hypothetical protein SmJEL517_g04052 [Synchytrium microbalum]
MTWGEDSVANTGGGGGWRSASTTNNYSSSTNWGAGAEASSSNEKSWDSGNAAASFTDWNAGSGASAGGGGGGFGNNRYDERGNGGGDAERGSYRGGSGGDRTCRNCNEVGHISRECPHPKVANENTSCRNCEGKGHFSKDCPQITCNVCNQSGHKGNVCPTLTAPLARATDEECTAAWDEILAAEDIDDAKHAIKDYAGKDTTNTWPNIETRLREAGSKIYLAAKPKMLPPDKEIADLAGAGNKRYEVQVFFGRRGLKQAYKNPDSEDERKENLERLADAGITIRLRRRVGGKFEIPDFAKQHLNHKQSAYADGGCYRCGRMDHQSKDCKPTEEDEKRKAPATTAEKRAIVEVNVPKNENSQELATTANKKAIAALIVQNLEKAEEIVTIVFNLDMTVANVQNQGSIVAGTVKVKITKPLNAPIPPLKAVVIALVTFAKETVNFANQCPMNNKSSDNGGRTCRRCGEPGHQSRDCPSGGRSGSGGGGFSNSRSGGGGNEWGFNNNNNNRQQQGGGGSGGNNWGSNVFSGGGNNDNQQPGWNTAASSQISGQISSGW